MRFNELTATEQDALQAARYISLETFRRDGRGVATPVWCAWHAGEIWVFTAADAGKAKRVRGRARSTVARCDVRGGDVGPRVETQARIVTDAHEERAAYAALRARYGWQMWVTDLGSRLTNRIDRRAMIALRLVDGAAGP
ncbi:MAG TPA: PPOX class F420-dependent oxidoreductase [Pseudomonadales bacterium]|nr:PPOX class F420-dependent oxidoreductase [Pseudomonadales bacterium]